MRWGMRPTGLVVALVALLGLVTCLPGAAAAGAKQRIDVRPGPGAIADALDRVEDGVVLRVHAGRYREAFTIERRVKLVGVGKRRPVIDAECRDPSTVAVRADGVRLRRLKVIGADVANEVDFSGVSGGRVNDLVLKDTCDAEYGVNVFDTGPVTILKSRATGFDDAGFYIGEISSTPGGSIRVLQSESSNNHRGVIVENSAGGEIGVAQNDIHDNRVPIQGSTPTGVFINNSDGVTVYENEIARNGIGLHFSPGADGNSAAFNFFLDNALDIRNQGRGNCGLDNSVSTGNALPPC